MNKWVINHGSPSPLPSLPRTHTLKKVQCSIIVLSPSLYYSYRLPWVVWPRGLSFPTAPILSYHHYLHYTLTPCFVTSLPLFPIFHFNSPSNHSISIAFRFVFKPFSASLLVLLFSPYYRFRRPFKSPHRSAFVKFPLNLSPQP